MSSSSGDFTSHDGNRQRHRTDCCKPRHKRQIKSAHIRKSQFCSLLCPTSDFIGHHVTLGRELKLLTLVQTLIVLLIWSRILCECYESKHPKLFISVHRCCVTNVKHTHTHTALSLQPSIFDPALRPLSWHGKYCSVNSSSTWAAHLKTSALDSDAILTSALMNSGDRKP